STTQKSWSRGELRNGKSDTSLATFLVDTKMYGIRKDEGEFYACTGVQWDKIPYAEMHQTIQELDGQGYRIDEKKGMRLALNEPKIQGILKVLNQHRDIYDPGFFQSAPRGINCGTGFIRFDGDGEPELVEHSPLEHRQRFTLPGHWSRLLPNQGHLIRQALRV